MIDSLASMAILLSAFRERAVDDFPHAELFAEAARHVPPGAAFLDAGLGAARLLEDLPAETRYLGIPREDLVGAELGVERFDTVAFLGSLDIAGLDPVDALRRGLAALRPGGRLLVAELRRRDGWSLEGMVALLAHLGARVHAATSGGAAYLVVAGR